MGTAYALYCVKVRAGWLGVFLSINLACLSNDVFTHMLQVYDRASEGVHVEEHKESEAIPEDFSGDCDYSTPTNDSENVSSCKSSSKAPSTSNFVNIQKDSSVSKVVKMELSSTDEMKRIMKSSDHYEALGLARNKNIDVAVLRKEYLKKAMLVHPDKNMGSPIAGESFKKLQCAYEATITKVLSDSTKKRNYDEQLRKEESRSVCQKSNGTSKQKHDKGVLNVRIAASTIQPKMEMDGLNMDAHLSLQFLRRLKSHVLLYVLKARFLMFQNGPFVRYTWDLDAEMTEDSDEEFQLLASSVKPQNAEIAGALSNCTTRKASGGDDLTWNNTVVVEILVEKGLKGGKTKRGQE
ncbi:hypothetical protein ACLOJK_021726 [Asimina triloba]